MAIPVDGKVVVVTGGVSGIGEAIAQRMVADGATVIAADLAATSTVLAGDSLTDFRVDVSNPQSVNTLFEAVLQRHGRVDCVVHSAGIGKDVDFLDTPIEAFDQIVAVNLRGTFIVGQSSARAMRRCGTRGCIVNIGSISGLTGNVGRAAYGATKGGVTTMSLVMALELAAFGIRVNVVAPGAIQTALAEKVHTQNTRMQWIEQIPLHRYGMPNEVAAAVAYLCSDDASYVTGHVLVVDGGFMGAGLRSRG